MSGLLAQKLTLEYSDDGMAGWQNLPLEKRLIDGQGRIEVFRPAGQESGFFRLRIDGSAQV